MNHKWKDDKCINCGITRQKRRYKKLQYTNSKLVHGVWEDIPVYQEGLAWSYFDLDGQGFGFNRPDCKKQK